LFGVHGAGHTNAIFARPGVGVVEAIGNARPAYYRNINMLLGQNYQSIIGDPIHGIGDDNYMMDLEEARSALIKARDHAAEWIEKNGHWR
jgi:capsular polysaccharide biosynthesis protein